MVVSGVPDVVARDAELAQLETFLASCSSAVLVLEGAAGIGKTTLWELGMQHARSRDMQVLCSRPVQSEAQLSYAAVGDLLQPVADAVSARLPEPLRHALDAALLTDAATGGPVAPRAIGLAVAAAVRLLAEEKPVVLAVDDVHWLDAASATAIGFALRRMDEIPVLALLAERPGQSPAALTLDRPPLSDRVRRVAVTPLSLSALQRVLRSRLGLVLPRPQLRRLHDVSGGNPFHALELAQAMVEGHVPEATRSLLRHRLAGASEATRRALVHAALLSSPDLRALDASLGTGAAELLEPAVVAGVVTTHAGRVAFTHPLYAAAVTADASAPELEAAHRALADTAPSREERARHLALATSDADPQVAERLESAARAASARGAPDAAAHLAHEAVRLTPEQDAIAWARRSTLAGTMTFVAGDGDRAIEILSAAARRSPTANLRAKALARLARALHHGRALSEAAAAYREGLTASGDDPAVLAELHEGLAWVMLLQRRDLEGVATAAAAAADRAREAGDRATEGDALSALFQAEMMLGRGYPSERIAEARATGEDTWDLPGQRMMRDPRFHEGLALLMADRVPEARATYERALERAVAGGDDSAQPFALMRLSHALFLGGDLPAAVARATEGLALAEVLGQRPREAALLCTLALYAALGGDVDAARAAGERGLAYALRMEDGIARRLGQWALGHAELLAGEPAAALVHLEELHAESQAAGIRDPGENRHVRDLLEARVAAGRPADAVDLAAELLELGERLGRSTAVVTARCALALAASARGEHDAAVAEAEAASARPVALPFDAARNALATGVVLRRARRRREARGRLTDAVAQFERIGAAGWAARAREEAARIGGRAPSDGELTPAERAVAELVAAGRTNSETARALFITDRTVETHLSHVYSKLGVRSRAELAVRFRSIT